MSRVFQIAVRGGGRVNTLNGGGDRKFNGGGGGGGGYFFYRMKGTWGGVILVFQNNFL